MAKDELHIVTGAFGFSGRYITRKLLDRGIRVHTLTHRPQSSSPFGDRVRAMPPSFDDPAALTESLRGAEVVYNTYWIRYAHGDATHQRAVDNTRILMRCAAEAGVGRFVHISITNPSEDSGLAYFRGKAVLERTLLESGLSHAILRPTVLFGAGDILINNIAWMLRKLPVFGVFGRGDYRLQPVHVDDLAELAVNAATERDNRTLDAVGPETFTYEQLIRLIHTAVGSGATLIHLPPSIARAVGRCLGWALGDVIITREEIQGLMSNLLISDQSPTCPTRFSEWLGQNACGLGRHYASELKRHYHQKKR
ncbi:MAG: SDR family oxidoreductase [Phycisphaerae bacterium]